MVASASVAMNAPYLLKHGIYLVIALIGFLVVLAVPLKILGALSSVGLGWRSRPMHRHLDPRGGG